MLTTPSSSSWVSLASASGIILSWMFVSSDNPWLIDSRANSLLVNKWTPGNSDLANSASIDQWLNNLQYDSRNASEPVKQLLLMHYRFSSQCFLLSSVLLCFITMLAARNRVLTLMTHISLLIWLWIFGSVMRPYSENSLHKRLYFFSLASSVVAIICYLVHLYSIRNRIIQQEHQKRELKEQRRRHPEESNVTNDDKKKNQ